MSLYNMGKLTISINYFSSKVKCYTTLFHTLVEKSKVAKILIFNPEFFQVLPVSFETPPAHPEFYFQLPYLHIGTISTELR